MTSSCLSAFHLINTFMSCCGMECAAPRYRWLGRRLLVSFETKKEKWDKARAVLLYFRIVNFIITFNMFMYAPTTRANFWLSATYLAINPILISKL